MNEEIKVSVALASYNGEKYLKEQIDSILNQSYKNIELIISDDNSTDNTDNIVSKFMAVDTRVKYFKNKLEKGFVNNFENALSFCTGEFIALSDQDDIWNSNKIETLLTNIGSSSLIHSDATLVDVRGNTISESYTKSAKKNIDHVDVIDVIINNPVTGCTLMFNRSLLDISIPFPRNLAVHDKWLALMATLENGIKYYDASLINYRQHGGNLIGASYKSKNLFEKYKSVKRKKSSDVIHNETLQYELINSIRKYSLPDDVNRDLEWLGIYYFNIMNSNFPIKAFIIRCIYFSRFEKGKSIKMRFVSLLAVFKKTIIRVL